MFVKWLTRVLCKEYVLGNVHYIVKLTCTTLKCFQEFVEDILNIFAFLLESVK